MRRARWGISTSLNATRQRGSVDRVQVGGRATARRWPGAYYAGRKGANTEVVSVSPGSATRNCVTRCSNQESETMVARPVNLWQSRSEIPNLPGADPDGGFFIRTAGKVQRPKY